MDWGVQAHKLPTRPNLQTLTFLEDKTQSQTTGPPVEAQTPHPFHFFTYDSTWSAHAEVA